MPRYSLQELSFGGFPYYEIIDTAKRCELIAGSKDYAQISTYCDWLNINDNMPVYYNGKQI